MRFFWVSICLLARSTLWIINLLLESLQILVFQLKPDTTCDSLLLLSINIFGLKPLNWNFISYNSNELIFLLGSISKVSLLYSFFFLVYLIDSFSGWVVNPSYFCSTRDRVILLIDEFNKLFTLFIRNLCILLPH